MAIDTQALDEQIAALEQTLGGSAQMAAAFDSELGRMRDGIAATTKEVGYLTAGFGNGLQQALNGLVFGGKSLSDALDGLARSMVNTVYSAATKPVTSAVGSLLSAGMESLWGGSAFAKGGAFTEGRVMPFATGGVVSGPTTFAMRGGTGLMGEAGPEAIMPLARGADGSLGVRMQGQAPAVNVVMNITTPDVQGFQRSQGQIAQQVSRVLAQGQRNA